MVYQILVASRANIKTEGLFMWMTKIKKYLQELDRTPLLNAVFMFSMLCIALVFIFAVINGVEQILGLESAEKIISAISSLATALTLAFLVYQHKDNASKTYQIKIVEEAKLVVDKLIEQIEIIKSWDRKDVSILGGCLARMSNHAQDFDSFFDEVKDFALREVLLVRWQDMYFNHYISVMMGITVSSIVSKNIKPIELERIGKAEDLFKVAKEKYESGIVSYYQATLYAIVEAKDSGVIDIPSKIGKQINFKHYFLEEKQLNKFLQGRDKSLDVKEKYSVLCAIVDASLAY